MMRGNSVWICRKALGTSPIEEVKSLSRSTTVAENSTIWMIEETMPMAEALAVIGIVSSIIQIVEFSATVVERLNDFTSSIGEVPRAFRHIQTELPLIIDGLRRIQNQAQSGSVEKATTDAVRPVLKDCQREITRLQNILDKTVPSVGASSWDRRKKAIL